MQSINLNHQNEVNQLLANVNELLCSPTTISNSCCCKVADLKMQVLQLRNDILILGYGTFFRRLRQYKSMYQQLLCKICNGNVDAMCEFGRQLYINQIENVTYSIDSNHFTINSITTTMGNVLSWTNITAYNSETNVPISVNPSAIAEIDISYLGSLGGLTVTFVCSDNIDYDLRFSVYIVKGQGVIAISIPTITEGVGYPIASNYYMRENTNKTNLNIFTSYIGYTSTKTPILSSADGADVIYNDLGHTTYYDINAVYNTTLGANFGNKVLPARIALRQTCLTQNTSCTTVIPSIVFDSVGSSYNSGTDTATLVFTDTSNYQGNPIDYIYVEESLNGIYLDSLVDNGSGIVTVSGGDIIVTIKDYSTFLLDSDWNILIGVILKTCDNSSVSELVIDVNDLPHPPEV